MGFEIDFLPVGEESNGGDAIIIRYGDLFGGRDGQTIIAVDGGFKNSGEKLVEHVQRRFDTDLIDVVVSTHPDQDHSSGLTVVLEECRVDALWMHLPWLHSTEMAKLRTSRFASTRMSEAVTASLQNVSDLAEIANSKGIPIVEPFTGVQTADGVLRVVGPSETYYEQLLDEIVEGQSLVQSITHALGEIIEKAAQKLLPESLYEETLTDAGSTTPRNNSSVISMLVTDGSYLLLTADAGATALDQALDQLAGMGVATGDLGFVQVPHHGSRRNVGPTVLDRLLGPKGADLKIGTAFVSAPKKNPDHKHPSKKVANAFRRRGYPVYATQGVLICHPHNAPDRPDFSPATPLPFYDHVEADGDD